MSQALTTNYEVLRSEERTIWIATVGVSLFASAVMVQFMMAYPELIATFAIAG